MSGRPASPHSLASAEEPVVFVVDDDASMRDALSNLFRSVGLRVEVFGSAHEFLQSTLPNVASCLILDIRLPRLSGLDFQAELAKADIRIPIIFMAKYYPDGDKDSSFNSYGYSTSQLMIYVLQKCGDNLTRENVMGGEIIQHIGRREDQSPGIRQ